MTPGPAPTLKHEFRVFIDGFVVWLLFVVHANLLGLKILTGQNVEFLGFMVFVACLGYLSARRTFANEDFGGLHLKCKRFCSDLEWFP
jgi:hypothetical protein